MCLMGNSNCTNCIDPEHFNDVKIITLINGHTGFIIESELNNDTDYNGDNRLYSEIYSAMNERRCVGKLIRVIII